MDAHEMAGPQTGIWIDRSRAVLIELFPDGTQRTRTIRSDVERGAKSQGGALGRAGSHRIGGANHLRLAERRLNALRSFYRQVWEAAAGDGEVVIFGPGLAPAELAKAAGDDRPERIREVIPLDHPTEAQLRARVREYFGHPAPRTRVGRGPATAG